MFANYNHLHVFGLTHLKPFIPYKRMSVDEIRVACGLKPHAEHQFDVLCTLAERSKNMSREYAIKETFRQTGRTTEMLLRALSDASAGKCVMFVGHTLTFANRLRDRFFKMAQQVGIKTRNDCVDVCDSSTQGQAILTLDDGWNIHTDHLVMGEP